MFFLMCAFSLNTIHCTAAMVAICKVRRDSEHKGDLRDLVTALDCKAAAVSGSNPQDLHNLLVQHDSTGEHCTGFSAAVGELTELVSVHQVARARASYGEVAGPSHGKDQHHAIATTLLLGPSRESSKQRYQLSRKKAAFVCEKPTVALSPKMVPWTSDRGCWPRKRGWEQRWGRP